MRQAYLDCSSGISGDMFLAALIDAGAPVDRLFAELKKLRPLGYYEFKRTRALRGGLVGTRVDIRVPGEQPHRHLADIQIILEQASLPEKPAAQALKIFQRLAEVEGKLHNVPASEIHFHEVGAVDAVIDVVGVCVALDLLEISELICSPLNVGGGHVDAAHGTLPVPAPATAELLKDIPVYSTGVDGELVTPTGAVLVASLASSFGPLPSMKISKIGYGAGEKDYSDHPNIARIFIGEPVEAVTAQPGLPGDDVVSVIETTVDDMSPQAYAEFLELATAAGALDVACSEARLNKNRPGLAISILCQPEDSEFLSQLLFEKGATHAMRISEARRKVSEHAPATVETPSTDEIVSVVETAVDELSAPAYGEFLQQLWDAGALDVTCGEARLLNHRPGLTLGVVCEADKTEAISQLLLEKSATHDVRISEARRKKLEHEESTVITPPGDEIVAVIAATLNEMTPQIYGQFLEQALAAGAMDVTGSPARMNSNRSGIAISLVCEPDKKDAITHLLTEKSARGVRVSEARRKPVEGEQPAPEPVSSDETVSVIEANVDDMSPQIYGYFMEQALAAGALNVTCSSAQMKKNRPGLTISIVCEQGHTDALSELIFEQTTTIGVRIYEARRKVLDREMVTVATPYGDVQIKVARRDGKVLNAAPEFDDCQRLAAEKSVPLKQVIAAAEAAYLQTIANSGS